MPNQQPGRRSRLAWALLGLTVVLVAASLVIAFTGGETWNQKLATTPVVVAFAAVGALVAARTGNRLGWLFLFAAAAGAVSLAAEAYAARAPADRLPGAAWAGWIFTVVLGIVATLFFLVPLLFPDGRPPSRRWWPVVWIAIIDALVQMVTVALSDANFSNNFPGLRDPVTVVSPLGTAYNQAEAVGLLVLLAGVISIIVRFRRSGQEERLQLKWFMYASAVAAVPIVVAAQLANDPLLEWEIVFPLFPVAVGIAILKYRLYDIDRIISRTLSYAIVTGLLVGLYAGLVLLATQVLRFHSTVAVAAATLVAAALFAPLRRRVQHVVDRRFNRVRYDADQTVAAFAARLRDAVDLDTVRSDLLTVVSHAVEPAHLSVWTARRNPGRPSGLPQRVGGRRQRVVLLVHRRVPRRHVERQAQRGLARRPDHPAQPQARGGLEHVEVHGHVRVERDRRGGQARGGDVGQVHHRVGARQRLDRLPVIGQVGPEHAFEAIGFGDRDVGRGHLVTVLEEVPHHCPARQAGRSRHADPLCHPGPFAFPDRLFSRAFQTAGQARAPGDPLQVLLAVQRVVVGSRPGRRHPGNRLVAVERALQDAVAAGQRREFLP